MVNVSLVLELPVVISIVPLLLTVTNWPGVKASTTPVLANSVLVPSRLSVPVPVALSPSLSVPPRVSSEPLSICTVSQLVNRLGSPALVLSRVRVSTPRPPSISCAAANCEPTRFCSKALSSPAAISTNDHHRNAAATLHHCLSEAFYRGTVPQTKLSASSPQQPRWDCQSRLALSSCW